MVSMEDLKKIYLLRNLNDAMLEELQPMVTMLHFNHREIVFDQGQDPSQFYMLRKGKVLLKVDVSPTVTISLGAVKPGYSFGWSSLMKLGPYTSQAVCAEPSDVLTVEGEKFKALLVPILKCDSHKKRLQV
jgi:CRP-like cAMP-binding protein